MKKNKHKMPQEPSEGETKLSIAKVNRKIAKPIMEKKRRARINASLNELKNLLVEVLQKEGCRHSSKMEKADILEMAVRHLKNLQRQQAVNSSYQSTGMRDAFPVKDQQCDLSPQIGNQFSSLPEKFSPDSKSTNNIVIPQPIKLDIKTGLPMTIPAQLPPATAGQLTNATSPQGGCQPMMTRTPNGELAVLLPQTLLNQKQIGSNLVLPLYSFPQVLSENQTEKLASPSTTPLSPVWRPW